MNGLLLNEHRMFNECAKEYAVQHLQRDYQAMKASVKQFMQVKHSSFVFGLMQSVEHFLDVVTKEK